MTAKIILMDGDQTGQEMLDEAVRVLDPKNTGVDVEFVHYDLTLENRRKTDNKVVYEACEAVKKYGVGIKAATITSEDIGSPNRIMREELNAQVILRAGKRLPNVTPKAGVYHPMWVVRMATGDAYGAVESRYVKDGIEYARRTETISAKVCGAVAEYAFRLAEQEGARVYGGPKWTVSAVYEHMLYEKMNEAAARHPNVDYWPELIDATFAGIITGKVTDKPIVIPSLNRDGDLLTDFVIPLYGSIAGAESTILSFDDDYNVKHVLCEAPHGTAPTLEGKNVANPMAMILSGAAALRYLGKLQNIPEAETAGVALYAAIDEVLKTGYRTSDLGGHATMTGFTDAVIKELRSGLNR